MISGMSPKKKSMKGSSLNAKHRQLADEYLANGLCAAAAARSVGYKHPAVIVHKIFKRPEVRKYVENRLAEIQEDQALRRAELLAKMRRLNDFNLMHAVVSSNGGMLEISAENFEQVADEIGDCVTEVEVVVVEAEDGTKESRVRIKLMSKDKNFDRELQYHGLVSIDNNLNISVNQAKVIDFDQLCSPPNEKDVVEGKIKGK